MTEKASILLLNGPNLNTLGRREPEIYGSATLADVENAVTRRAAGLDATVATLQSNAEHLLVERVQAAADDGTDAIIINAAALTHTSVALRDALAYAALPFWEVHISNVFARETFRELSYLSDIATGVIVGCGPVGYELALEAAIAHLRPPA
ncbi:MAG: type II 3-dehydroquinate dehydratase [Pseudomonadota bacterium]